MNFFRKTDKAHSGEVKKTVPRKIGLFSTLAIVIVSSLITVATPFLTNTALAVTSDDVLNRARAWSMLNAIIDDRGKVDSSISDTDVSNCHIFGELDANEVYVGPHVTTNADRTKSNWKELEQHVDVANAALASVGINGGCRGLLTAMGYTESDGAMHQSGDFGNKLSQRLHDAVSADAFFGAHLGDGGPGDAISYAMLYYDLVNVCGWEFRNPYVPNDGPSETGLRNQEAQGNGWSGDSDNSHFHTWTVENGGAGDNTYYKGGGSQDDINVGSKSGFAPSGDNDALLDCGDNNADTFGAKLGDNHRFADAYAALIRPGGQYTPGTCKEAFTTAPEQDACDQGFKNKADANFCKNTFGSNPGLLKACEYGAQTATGGKDATTAPTASKAAESKPTCVVEGIGWFICPVVNLMAKVVDGAYTLVSSLLSVQPILTTGQSAPLYQAWSIMRNFANIAFVVVFLFIIFSQVTGVGIKNHGIKVLLPKLVVGAVLVNISYFVCAIAVDLSNILGVSLNDLLNGAKKTVSPAAVGGSAATGAGWAGIAGGILAGTLVTVALLYVTLAALLPVLLAALFAIVTVFLVLTLRQALIILLVVVSPLAFVAYLLPNTEGLFKKWRELFQSLLLMYPIISLIFGASALASTIIMNGAKGSVAIGVMGAGISIIPLAITPVVMKASGTLLGGLMRNNPTKGLYDRSRKKAEGYRDYRKDVARGNRIDRGKSILTGSGGKMGEQYSRRRRFAAMISSGGQTTSINSDRKRDFTKAIGDENAQEYFAQRALNDSGFAEKVAGSKKSQGLKASAQSAVDKIIKQDIANREILLTADVKFKNNPQAALDEALAKEGGGDRVQAAAAMNMLMKTGAGGYDKIHEAIEKAEKAGHGDNAAMEGLRDHIKENGQAVKARDPTMTAWAGQDRSEGKQPQSLESMATTDGPDGKNGNIVKKSDAEVAAFSPETLKRAKDSGFITAEQAKSILSNPNVVKDASAANIETLKQLVQHPDGRADPTPQELTIAHEEAHVQNALHDMNNRNNP